MTPQALHTPTAAATRPGTAPAGARPRADAADPAAQARLRQVEMVLEHLDALPTLSPVALRLLQLGSADEVDLDEVVRLLETDPALTAMILGLCRRADRGLGEKIDTVRRAVVMLGIEAVRSAVLGVHVYDLVHGTAGEMDKLGRAPTEHDLAESGGRLAAFDRVGLWTHSVAVACCAELVAKRHPELDVRPEQAFVAGLLHDLGKLVLELVLPRALARVAALAEQRGADCAPVARALIGLDPHTAGRRVATRWQLPAAVSDVIWLHGQPLSSVPEGPHRALIGVVSLADVICRRQHLGWSCDYAETPAPEEIARALSLRGGVDAEGERDLIEELLPEVVERCRILRLEEHSEPRLLLASISEANRRLSSLNRTLTERATLARAQGRVLEAISTFCATWSARLGTAETLEHVARSAEGVMGRGFFAAVVQHAAGEDWEVHQFAPGGRLSRSTAMEPPTGQTVRGESLGTLIQSVGLPGGARGQRAADGGGLSVAALGLLPWLSDFLGDAVDLRRVRLLPLCGAGEGVAALLLHDREEAAGDFGPAGLDPLRGAWAAALQAAASSEDAARTGDRLAEVNRALAETQARLTERESLARLGEMSAGAAHEMNNPLTVIRGRSQLLARRLTDPRDQVDAATIAEAAKHLSELITSLHLLADPPAPKWGTFTTDTLVARALDAAETRLTGEGGLAGTARVRIDQAAERLEGDRELLAAALAEAIVNAWQACDGGEVDLSAERDALDGRLVITVADRGPGLSPKAVRHAFDPFFSELPAGRRTGLGLSRARRLVELHGGEIAVDNRPGGGARVTVMLPPAGEASGVAERRAAG